MLTALTREVSPALAACELEYHSRQPIDVEKASRQHRAYEECLRDLGARVVSLPADRELPDSVFVEDPAIVVDEIAVIARMGSVPRRKESESIANALAPYRPLKWIREPATLEGGDVMRAGKTLYAGVSRRTNREGVEQLSALLDPFGYRVAPVKVEGCLHLKSACSYLGDNTVLINRHWIELNELMDFDIIDVPEDEPGAANVLSIGDTVLIPASFPATAKLLKKAGFQVRALDISELQKAEAAMTCSSLIFDPLTAVRGSVTEPRTIVSGP